MNIVDETMRLIHHPHYSRKVEESRHLFDVVPDGSELILVSPVRTGKTRDHGERLLRHRSSRTPKRGG